MNNSICNDEVNENTNKENDIINDDNYIINEKDNENDGIDINFFNTEVLLLFFNEQIFVIIFFNDFE